MARLKTVYILSIDNYGQPSGDITEVKMTRYFKHFHKSENDFVTDKNGERIIDR